jgi:hypothetical protein
MKIEGGGVLQISPIHIDLKNPHIKVQRRQYLIPLEGRLGLKPIIEGLLKDGRLEPCMAPFNAPIPPVRKSDGSYQPVQDLNALNQIVRSKYPVVPNPYTLLIRILPDHQWFS